MLIISDSYRLFLLSITTYRNLGQARDQSGHKCAKIWIYFACCLCPILKKKLKYSRQFSIRPRSSSPNTKFKNNLSAGYELFHADGCPDMTQKIAAFRTFAKATEKFCESKND